MYRTEVSTMTTFGVAFGLFFAGGMGLFSDMFGALGSLWLDLF